MGKFGVFGEYIEALFNEHKFIRRTGVILCWHMNIAILVATIYAWFLGISMSDNTQFILATMLGLNQAYIGLYQWDRARE